MSTIAYDGKSIAFETQCGYGNRIDPYAWEKVRKIEGSVNYAFAGGVGMTDIVDEFIDWITNGGEYPKLCLDRADDSTFIAVTHDGELHEFERRDQPALKTRKIDAFGSGAMYAMGAMHAGASAHDAVLIASKCDPYSNDDVRSFDLDQMDLHLTSNV